MIDDTSDRRAASNRNQDRPSRRTFLATVGAGVGTGLLGTGLAVDPAQAVPSDAPAIDAPGGQSWQMVWRDEFDGSIDDAWTHETGGGCGEHARLDTDCSWGNQEEQYYTAGENAFVEDGSLVIEAREETAPNGINQYTSGRLKTQGAHTMQYGRLDVRATLPEGQGIWPAIWMLGGYNWPDDGEIDVMEFLGHDTDTIHANVHGPGYSGANGISGSYTDQSVNFSESAHTFSMVWQSDRIDWYVDGEHYHKVTRSAVESAGHQWVFDHGFFFLLNVAVGGTWPGYPDASTDFPQRMVVDHVRQYAAVETTPTETETPTETRTETPTPTETPEGPTWPTDPPATDPDGDGLYEDLSGNNQIDFPDVNTLFQHSDTAMVRDNARYYDFEASDGSITLQDVMALFEMV